MVRVQLARRCLFLAVAAVVGCAPRDAVVAVPTVEVTVRDASGRPLEELDTNAQDDGHAAGDLVEVEWHGSWWPAVLVERRRSGWFVHYDREASPRENYAKDWDEVVSVVRVRDRRTRTGTDEPSIEPMDEDVDP